ncbi:hypothetical protein BX600DRAFT_518364 [Xylariales sp. PMI_506]|nr:hypothetical protein BX600DRAFT_518364 [Xylariales sp. PMI_506]
MCRDSTLGDAVSRLSSIIVNECNNLDDATTAVSVLTAYCASKGYTKIVSPTTLPATGAYTVTVTTTESVFTVVQTQYVSTAPHLMPASPFGVVWGVLLTNMIAGFGSFVWLFVRQRLRARI